jgi:L-ascorbate metabolism protein UlaG (beta-lactamase superfamily)
MEITYIGHSCFKIKGKELSLVIDPYDPKIGFKLPKLEADVVLSTHDHPDHANLSAVTGTRFTIKDPGEYEISDVFIEGLATFHDAKSGTQRGANIVYSIDIDGFTLLHLGDLGHELSDETLENIGSVDVLMIPVGGFYTINSEVASKVISSIEPGFVIPMHYKTPDLNPSVSKEMDGLDKFLNEMGVEKDVKRLDKLKLSSKGEVPEETEIVVLNPAH